MKSANCSLWRLTLFPSFRLRIDSQGNQRPMVESPKHELSFSDHLVCLFQISVDDFQWECILGKGGFGRVRAVVHLDSEEWYAAKIVSKAKILSKRNGLAMLENELRILAQLPISPHWITLHWAFTDA